MKTTITPLLMFEGKAEEAMRFYCSLFEDAAIQNMTLYKANEAGEEGKVMMAQLYLNGQNLMCVDSVTEHNFTFTPSFSFFVKCQSKEEVMRLYGAFAKEGNVLMPLNNYGFSQLFTWVEDQFGISWQLNLE